MDVNEPPVRREGGLGRIGRDTEPAGEQLAETDDGAPRHAPTSLLGSLQAWLNRR